MPTKVNIIDLTDEEIKRYCQEYGLSDQRASYDDPKKRYYYQEKETLKQKKDANGNQAYTEEQINRLIFRHSSIKSVLAVIKYHETLLSLGLNSDAIYKMAYCPNCLENINCLIYQTNILQKQNLNWQARGIVLDDAVHLYSRDFGAIIFQEVLKYSPRLFILGFSMKDIIQIIDLSYEHLATLVMFDNNLHKTLGLKQVAALPKNRQFKINMQEILNNAALYENFGFTNKEITMLHDVFSINNVPTETVETLHSLPSINMDTTAVPLRPETIEEDPEFLALFELLSENDTDSQTNSELSFEQNSQDNWEMISDDELQDLLDSELVDENERRTSPTLIENSMSAPVAHNHNPDSKNNVVTLTDEEIRRYCQEYKLSNQRAPYNDPKKRYYYKEKEELTQKKDAHGNQAYTEEQINRLIFGTYSKNRVLAVINHHEQLIRLGLNPDAIYKMGTRQGGSKNIECFILQTEDLKAQNLSWQMLGIKVDDAVSICSRRNGSTKLQKFLQIYPLLLTLGFSMKDVIDIVVLSSKKFFFLTKFIREFLNKFSPEQIDTLSKNKAFKKNIRKIMHSKESYEKFNFTHKERRILRKIFSTDDKSAKTHETVRNQPSNITADVSMGPETITDDLPLDYDPPLIELVELFAESTDREKNSELFPEQGLKNNDEHEDDDSLISDEETCEEVWRLVPSTAEVSMGPEAIDHSAAFIALLELASADSKLSSRQRSQDNSDHEHHNVMISDDEFPDLLDDLLEDKREIEIPSSPRYDPSFFVPADDPKQNKRPRNNVVTPDDQNKRHKK